MAQAQEPELEARINRSEVIEGVGFELTFMLKGAETADFTAPDFKGFRLLSGPHLMTGFTMINRNYFRHQSRIYELQALKSGVYTIGPATAVINGKTIRSKPLKVRVLPSPGAAPPSSRAPAPASDEGVLLAARVVPQRVYDGQQLIWQLRIYTARSIDFADVVQLPDFAGFSHKERRRFDNRVLPDTLKGRSYSAKTLYEQALFPLTSGILNVGQSAVRAEVSEDIGLGRISFPRSIMLQSDSLRVLVEPLPTPRPADFCGAVGDYTYSVRYPEAREYGLEDAVVIEMTLSGNGDPRRIKPPVWPLPEGLDMSAPRLIQEDVYESESGFAHAFTYQYVLFPQKPGDYSVWPQAVFFDPTKQRYDTLRADAAFAFAVREGKAQGRRDADAGSIGAEEWGALAAGLFAALSAVALLIFVVWRRRLRRDGGGAVVQPAAAPTARPMALAERIADLRALAERGPDDLFCHELLTRLSEVLVGRLGIPPTERDSARIFAELSGRQIDPELVERFKNLWRTCELSAYGGVPLREGTLSVWGMSGEVLSSLDKAL